MNWSRPASRSRARLRAAAVLGTGLALFGAACSGEDDPEASGGTQGPGGTTATSEDTGEAPADGEPYRVVVVTDLSGVTSFYGTPSSEGITAAIELVNSQGGVNGRQIEVVDTIDDAGDVTTGTAAYQQAIAAEPVAIIGFSGSFIMDGIDGLLAEAGIPVIQTTGGAAGLASDPPADYLFAVAPTAPQQAVALLDKAEDELGSLEGATVGIITNSASPALQAQKGIIQELAAERGFEVVFTEDPEAQVPSYDAQAPAVVSAAPDALFVIHNGPATVTISKSVLTAGYEGPIITPNNASSTADIEAIGSAQYFVQRFATQPSANDEQQAALDAVGIDDDNSVTGSGFAVVSLLVAGLEACGPDCTAEQLLETFNAGIDDIESIAGTSLTPLSVAADDHQALTSLQYYTFDESSGEAVPAGDPIEIP